MFESSVIDKQVRLDLKSKFGEGTHPFAEISRGFGFIRFSSIEDSKAFVERNYPNIYLYGSNTSDNNDEAAKVRIAFSRERDDRSRGDKADGEWTCKIVGHTRTWIYYSVALLTFEKCTFVNFPGRIRCHRCQTPQIGTCPHRIEARRAHVLRYDNMRPDHSAEISVYEQRR